MNRTSPASLDGKGMSFNLGAKVDKNGVELSIEPTADGLADERTDEVLGGASRALQNP